YDFIDGFARHMRDALPNASFIGFTGTPIELTDKNTKAVFGDYIDVYDIQRAVEDGATVRIYYEGRLAKIELDPAERPKLDPEVVLASCSTVPPAILRAGGCFLHSAGRHPGSGPRGLRRSASVSCQAP